ncbi:skin secretory protein xP2-like [Pogoniulus pusillus]|uniref:skin secretory protein xP2-like n=1 Tax=Pogoniulus pusillus TaxID=488313 RepID=UPI0030B96BC4
MPPHLREMPAGRSLSPAPTTHQPSPLRCRPSPRVPAHGGGIQPAPDTMEIQGRAPVTPPPASVQLRRPLIPAQPEYGGEPRLPSAFPGIRPPPSPGALPVPRRAPSPGAFPAPLPAPAPPPLVAVNPSPASAPGSGDNGAAGNRATASSLPRRRNKARSGAGSPRTAPRSQHRHTWSAIKLLPHGSAMLESLRVEKTLKTIKSSHQPTTTTAVQPSPSAPHLCLLNISSDDDSTTTSLGGLFQCASRKAGDRLPRSIGSRQRCCQRLTAPSCSHQLLPVQYAAELIIIQR